MDQSEEISPKATGRIRKRRGWWRRKRFWIVLLAILGAFVTTLWLIQSITNFKETD